MAYDAIKYDRMSPTMARLTQLNETVLLSRMEEAQQQVVATRMGLPPSSITDFKRDHITRFCALAAACELKLVPIGHEVLTDNEIFALRVFAAGKLQIDQQLATERMRKRDAGLGRDQRREDGDEA